MKNTPPKVVPVIMPGFNAVVLFFAGMSGVEEELAAGEEVVTGIGEARVLSLSVDERTMLAELTTAFEKELFVAAFIGEGVSVPFASSVEGVLTFASSHQHPSLKEISQTYQQQG